MMRLAAMLWLIVGTAIAGIAMIVILATPSLIEQGMTLIPIAAGAGFLVAMPIAYVIAKKIGSGTDAKA